MDFAEIARRTSPEIAQKLQSRGGAEHGTRTAKNQPPPGGKTFQIRPGLTGLGGILYTRWIFWGFVAETIRRLNDDKETKKQGGRAAGSATTGGVKDERESKRGAQRL